MFIVWGLLASLYSVTAVQLLLKGDTGALVVAMMAVLFGFLCWRSYRKRKRKKENAK